MVNLSVAAAIIFVFWLSDGEEAIKDADSVMESPTSFVQYMEHLKCTVEDTDESDGLTSMPDCDSSVDSIAKQRRHHSSALLKKEQKQSRASSAEFIKVRIVL